MPFESTFPILIGRRDVATQSVAGARAGRPLLRLAERCRRASPDAQAARTFAAEVNGIDGA